MSISMYGDKGAKLIQIFDLYNIATETVQHLEHSVEAPGFVSLGGLAGHL